MSGMYTGCKIDQRKNIDKEREIFNLELPTKYTIPSKSDFTINTNNNCKENNPRIM